MRKRVFVALCCTFVFCLVLAGCSGGNASTAASGTSATSASTSSSSAQGSTEGAKANFVGTWDMVEMSDGKTITDELALKGAKKNGNDFYAQLDENGTITIVIGTESISGAWEATSDTEGRFAGPQGKTFAMSLVNDQLVLDFGDNTTLKYVPGEARAELPKASTASSTASASSSSSAAKSKASSKYEASIDDISVGEDYQGNPALIVTYTWKNNSNDSRSFASTLHPRCYQNGVQLNSAFMMGIDSNGYMADVRPGYGTTFQMAYELKDTQNPVDVEVYELASYKGSPIATKTYKF